MYAIMAIPNTMRIPHLTPGCLACLDEDDLAFLLGLRDISQFFDLKIADLATLWAL